MSFGRLCFANCVTLFAKSHDPTCMHFFSARSWPLSALFNRVQPWYLTLFSRGYLQKVFLLFFYRREHIFSEQKWLFFIVVALPRASQTLSNRSATRNCVFSTHFHHFLQPRPFFGRNPKFLYRIIFLKDSLWVFWD